MTTSILGLATATTTLSVAQAQAAELAKAYGCLTAEQERLLPVLYRRTHVGRRGSVVLEADHDGAGLRQTFYPAALAENDRGPTTRQRMERYALEAAPLAVTAARSALQQSGVDAEEITQLICVSCTGFAAPGVDIHLIHELGLSPSVGRTLIGFMGCHGALNGLRTAAAHTRADPAARALLVAVELCSLHYYYGWEPDKVVANALFADGAAALVAGVEASDTKNWRLAASGSCVFPDSQDAMSWRVGDHGFEMTLSARVPELISSQLRPWLEAWLAHQDVPLSDVKSWAIHPGGPRIVSSVAAALDLPESATAASNSVLAERGNMSSPTVLFILEKLRAAGAARPCVALGFGPGLAAEAALFI